MKYESMKLKNKDDRPFVMVPVLHEKRVATDLRSQDCLVYGYLLFLARKQNHATQTVVCNSLQIDRQCCKQSLARLKKHQLIQQDAVGYRAIEPSGHPVFRTQDKAKGDWYERFIYDRVYLPCSAKTLPVRANLLFWHLVRMAKPIQGMPGHLRLGGSDNRYYTHTYWATGIGCDRKTAGTSIQRLRELELIKIRSYHKGYAIGILPLGKHVELWRDSWQDKPRVAPALSAKELFSVPSPAPLHTEESLYGKIIKVLRGYGITGQLGEELAVEIMEQGICPTVWRPMLDKVQADHFANWEDGKTGNRHCGFLFRHVLCDYLAIRESNRAANAINRIRTSDEMNLAGAIGSLRLTDRERELVAEAIAREFLSGDDGRLIPCHLTAEAVIDLARAAKGNVRSFKNAVTAVLVGADAKEARAFRWIRCWLQGGDEELEDNTPLERAGVSEWQLADIRAWANYRLTGDHSPGTGEVVGRINTLLRLSCWQAVRGPNQTMGDAVMATLEELCRVVISRAPQDLDQVRRDEDRDGEITDRAKEIGKQWLALSK